MIGVNRERKSRPNDNLRRDRIGILQDDSLVIMFHECAEYAYRICDEESGRVSTDFPKEIRSLIKILLCYNKKQYCIFVDDRNSNSVRVASRKQYIQMQTRTMYKGNDLIYCNEIRRMFSQEASLVRLVREAIKYNKYAKFLKRLCENDLIKFCDDIMKSTSCGFEIVEAPIQVCYDSQLKETGMGSGKRFATHSCMYRHPVGKFYELFNVKGRVVMKNGTFVGRYLEWQMSNGKTYVDRLYVNGDVITPALNCLDEYYKGRTDIEFYPETPSGVVKMKNGNAKDFDKILYYPYLDTFSDLYHNEETEDMYLSKEKRLNVFDESKRFKSTTFESNIFSNYTCPACGKKFMSHDALRFHLLFETKTNKCRTYENNQKIKNIINKYMEEMQHV